MKAEIGKILGELYSWKQVNIIKAEETDLSAREIEKMVLKTSKHNRSEGMAEPYPYISRNTTENERIKFCGAFQWEE